MIGQFERLRDRRHVDQRIAAFKSSEQLLVIADISLYEPDILLLRKARRRRAVDVHDAVALAKRLRRNRLPDPAAASGKSEFHCPVLFRVDGLA